MSIREAAVSAVTVKQLVPMKQNSAGLPKIDLLFPDNGFVVVATISEIICAN